MPSVKKTKKNLNLLASKIRKTLMLIALEIARCVLHQPLPRLKLRGVSAITIVDTKITERPPDIKLERFSMKSRDKICHKQKYFQKYILQQKN